MEPHPFSKSSSAHASMSTETKTTLATQEAASCTQNEKASVEREVTVKKVIGPSAGIIVYKSTLQCLPFSLKAMIYHHDALDLMHSLYAELSLLDPTFLYPKNYI